MLCQIWTLGIDIIPKHFFKKNPRKRHGRKKTIKHFTTKTLVLRWTLSAPTGTSQWVHA